MGGPGSGRRKGSVKIGKAVKMTKNSAKFHKSIYPGGLMTKSESNRSRKLEQRLIRSDTRKSAAKGLKPKRSK